MKKLISQYPQEIQELFLSCQIDSILVACNLLVGMGESKKNVKFTVNSIATHFMNRIYKAERVSEWIYRRYPQPTWEDPCKETDRYDLLNMWLRDEKLKLMKDFTKFVNAGRLLKNDGY